MSNILRLKTFEVMQYFDYYDTNDINVIVDRIKELPNLKTYCGIIHDKDILDTGELKKKHFHLIITLRDVTTSTNIAKILHIEEQYINKIRTTTKSAELYLIHKNNPEKYQYNPSEVFSNFDYIEKYDNAKPLPDIYNIVNDISVGKIKMYNITNFIDGVTFAKHKVLFDRAFEYRQKNIKGVERNMECVFISGASGTGKTTFAKMLASNKGFECYISSGGKNPLDNYEGQECIILDDLRDSTYKLSDFLKLTDNNTDSLVGCRFYNKSINECKLLIVTSVKDIKDFYFNIAQEEKEPQQQLFRRFKTYIKMKNDIIEFYDYFEDLKEYKINTEVVNPVSVMFNKEISKNFSDNIIKTMKLKKYDSAEPHTNLF